MTFKVCRVHKIFDLALPFQTVCVKTESFPQVKLRGGVVSLVAKINLETFGDNYFTMTVAHANLSYSQ